MIQLKTKCFVREALGYDEAKVVYHLGPLRCTTKVRLPDDGEKDVLITLELLLTPDSTWSHINEVSAAGLVSQQRCQIRENAQKDSEYITYLYTVGPFKVVHILNLPRDGEQHSTVFIKVETAPCDLSWEEEPKK